MNNQKGFTVVEMIVSFALTMVIVVFLLNIIILIKDAYISNGIKTVLMNQQAVITKQIYDDVGQKKVRIITSCGTNCYDLYFADGTNTEMSLDPTNHLFTLGSYATNINDTATIGDLTINIESVASSSGFDSIVTFHFPITHKLVSGDFGVTLIYQYDSSVTSVLNSATTSAKGKVYYNGASTMYLIGSEAYDEPGYYTIDTNGNVTPNDSNVNVTNNVSSANGTYTVTYTYNSDVATRTVIRVSKTTTYSYYANNVQTYTVPRSGYYQIELYGARGGGLVTTLGKGGYTSGYIYLEQGLQLYFYVGGGGNAAGNATNSGGYNGGGYSGNYSTTYSYAGGGATDVRLVNGVWNDATSLASRLMVAAGGAGSSSSTTTAAGDGGGLVGGDETTSSATYNNSTYLFGGASQTASYGYDGRAGGFGYGIQSNTSGFGGGGGSGYYGGGTGFGTTGAGGSSFISGYAGVNAITSASSLTPTNNTIHYSGRYFIDGVMIAGISEDNGQAIITYVGSTMTKTTNKLNNVRYIKDCINGSSVNSSNHWVELQAIYNGINVALNLNVTSSSTVRTDGGTGSWNTITDGDISFANYVEATSTGNQCIYIDLGKLYDLDEVAVWHYWGDNRYYNNNVTSVSSDNVNWVKVIDISDVHETSIGKRVSAYE